MAEVIDILADSPAASRGPSAAGYKLIYTTTTTVTGSIHVNNGAAVDSGFRIAILEPGPAYVEGGVPPAYSFVHGGPANSVFLEVGGPGFDTPAFNLPIGTRIIVWCDNAGVTFLPHGFKFS